MASLFRTAEENWWGQILANLSKLPIEYDEMLVTPQPAVADAQTLSPMNIGSFPGR
jgi:hypothetical protein